MNETKDDLLNDTVHDIGRFMHHFPMAVVRTLEKESR